MHKILKSLTSAAAISLCFAFPAYAQMDEIIVTGSRISVADLDDITDYEAFGPGIFFEKKGDFLLLSVTIENDSRELRDRLSEMQKTVDGILNSVKSSPDIELSMVNNNIVRPLSRDKFNKSIRGGTRPDTSRAFIRVKTEIPDNVTDSYGLSVKLLDFVEGLDEFGRTKIVASGDVSVSIINPYQYRPEVIDKVINEIDAITEALGPDYRAVIRGLDREMTWVRSGDLNLAFTMPYKYDIIPNNLTTYR